MLDLRTLVSDPDGDPLTFAIQTRPAHADATVVTSALTFKPTSGYFGTDSFIYTVSDGKGGTAQATIAVMVSMAPPIETSVATDFASSTAFLYTGDHPITILNHLEFGQTLSRADGMFDMAVNGGGPLTVNYVKPGYLPVQRQVMAPWRDYVWLPDVVMIALDPNVTTIDLAANIPIQVARGSVISDTDGMRQETLLFPQGITAVMSLTNGTTQTLTTLHVRSTEYTVGDNGLKTMPAALPANSAYTYASEFSADEAVAAGATNLRFSQPIVSYNENFLNFPVGANVPLGYYDRSHGVWVSADNGRVIKLLSITSGLANYTGPHELHTRSA